MPPVVHPEDVSGGELLSGSGDFVVRTVAMDLTESRELREAYGWPDNVRLVTSLTDAEVPVPAEMLPHVMYGLGAVETGVVASNEISSRTVIFDSTRDFATLEEGRGPRILGGTPPGAGDDRLLPRVGGVVRLVQ